MAIFIFNVPARTMKREREALAGVPLLTSLEHIQLQSCLNYVSFLFFANPFHTANSG